jgi:hypothetical protein
MVPNVDEPRPDAGRGSLLSRGSVLGCAAPVDQAVGGESGTGQAVDRADHDVTEMVHAPVQTRVRDEHGDDRAEADTVRRSQVRSMLVAMMASEV